MAAGDATPQSSSYSSICPSPRVTVKMKEIPNVFFFFLKTNGESKQMSFSKMNAILLVYETLFFSYYFPEYIMSFTLPWLQEEGEGFCSLSVTHC